MYSFPELEPVYCSMFSSNCCFLTCIEISQKAGKVVWYSLLVSFPQFVVIHIIKGFFMVNRAEVGVFLESFSFSIILRMLAVWSLVPLSFLNPAWTYGISQFMYCWRLAWRNYFDSMWDECNCVVAEHSLKSPSMRIARKTTFSVLWPLLSFPQFLAYWVQHFNSIIF